MTTPAQPPAAHPGFLTDAELLSALNAPLGQTDPGGRAYLTVCWMPIGELRKRLDHPS